jgi:O-antigen/teichoic acid export membrane protein
MEERSVEQAAEGAGGVSVRRGFAWSGIFLVVTRLSSVAAVPIVLHELGTDLYAAWVLAGSLVLVQSLVDLGTSGALVRFAADAAARDSRHAVMVVTTRASLIYAVVSLVIAIPMWVLARDLADLLPYLHGSELTAAAVMVRYAAVAFVLTNLTLILGSVLQAVGRVDSSYRAQTIGWLAYVPLLLVGFEVVSDAHAIGVAWVGTYAIQLALLSWPTSVAVRRLGVAPAHAATWRELLSLGGRWQLVHWADFATFQLPRLIGGVTLKSAELVTLDLAIRAAQVVVGPVMAFFPVVVPTVSRTWATRGAGAVARLLEGWAVPGIVACALGAAAFLPIEAPAVAVWTGRSTASFDAWLGAAVVLGFLGHASTGLFSSALLAIGDIRLVLAYKTGQLVLAGMLLVPGALLGPLWLGLALTVALLLPAVAFNVRAASHLDVHLPRGMARLWRRLATAVTVVFAVPFALTLGLQDSLSALGVLLVAGPAAAVCAAGSWLLFARDRAGSLPPSVPTVDRAGAVN